MKPHAVRSPFLRKIRTSSPTVTGPDLLMTNMVSVADNTRLNAFCGPTAHPSSTCVLMRISPSLDEHLEQANSVRAKNDELAEAFVDMILPQLLSTSVTGDHTMRFPHQSRI